MTGMENIAYLPGGWSHPANGAGFRVPMVVSKHLDYLRLQGLAASTIDKRRHVLARLGAWLDRPLCEATAADLAAWRAGLTAGDDAIAAYLAHVRQFYRWLAETGILDDDPAAALPVPRLSPRLPRPIAEPALLDVVACAPDRIRAWLVLAGWAGLRAKEIALLRRERVLDTANPPALLIARDATKGRRERLVPMHDLVLEELLPVLPASGWVFRRRDGHAGPNAPHTVSHLCNMHLHACGYPAVLHQLRHRFGTGTYQACKDIRVVQELMGHASPSTTAGYAAYSNADAAAAVQALPAPGHLRVVPDGYPIYEKGV